MARQAHEEKPQPNKFLPFLAWKKMNTKVARQNLGDDECAWAENVQPIGPNDWQACASPLSPALTTSLGSNTQRIWGASFNNTDFLVEWQANGALAITNANTGSSVFPLSSLTDPDITVWASQRLLGIDPVGGYFTYDGTCACFSGTLSPNINVTAGGTGYSNSFAVTFAGGSGSGATATGTAVGGVVVSIKLTNGGSGYHVGDVITVNLTAGGGTGATANARIWPQGIFGNTLDIFSGRVWIGNGRTITFTGTGGSTGGVGYDNFVAGDASGTSTLLDQDLSHAITVIRNLNNYLYIFGDKSTRQIGSISVASSVTQFTPLTLASDIGTTSKMTVQSYNRLVLFANVAGVYGIFGASVKKISDDLDGIFQLLDFTLPLSAGVVDVHATITEGGSLHCYALLVRYMDPLLFTRTLLLMYQDNQWWIARQGDSLLAVGSIFLASTNHFELFGSSGVDLTHLLENSTGNVQILFRTALSFNRDPFVSKRYIRAGVACTSAFPQNFTLLAETEDSLFTINLTSAGTVTWVNGSGQVVTWQNISSQTVTFGSGGYRFPYADAEGEGRVLGCTIEATVSQFSINAVGIEYVDGALWGGGGPN